MIEIPSQLEGKQFDLNQLEQKLKAEGFIIGGSWEYDHGSFDYKMGDQDGYQFLRLPFQAVSGELDSRNCTIELGRPFLLAHVYQANLDDSAHVDNGSAAFNQFQEPADADGTVPDEYIEIGKRLIQKIESSLLNH